jgi:hypothetical protein
MSLRLRAKGSAASAGGLSSSGSLLAASRSQLPAARQNPYCRHMEIGHFVTSGWDSGPVGRAGTFRERLDGLRRSPVGHGLWLVGPSVHSFGMTEPLIAVGLDRNLMVINVSQLQPRQWIWIGGAKSILELPPDRVPPIIGSVLTWLHARSADPLRHADRESG